MPPECERNIALGKQEVAHGPGRSTPDTSTASSPGPLPGPDTSSAGSRDHRVPSRRWSSSCIGPFSPTSFAMPTASAEIPCGEVTDIRSVSNPCAWWPGAATANHVEHGVDIAGVGVAGGTPRAWW